MHDHHGEPPVRPSAHPRCLAGRRLCSFRARPLCKDQTPWDNRRFAMLWRRPLPRTLLKGTRTAGPSLLRSCLGPSCSAWTITGMRRSLRVPNTITCTCEGEVRHVGGGKRQGWLCSTLNTFPFLGCPSAALSLTGPPAEIVQLFFKSLGHPYKTKHSSQGHLFSKAKAGQ